MIFIFTAVREHTFAAKKLRLLNSIEGKRGMPRFKPPFPANFGLWGCPTTINNIETLANIPPIIEKGGEWFSKIGEPKHAGSLLYGLSGHINKPGVYELAFRHIAD